MKRLLLLVILSSLTLVLSANSPVNFGLNFRLNMPRTSFETVEWNTATTTDGLEDVLDNSEMGYAGGVFLRFNKGKGFLHSEAMFSFNSTGFTALEGSSLKTINYSTESTTFNVPVFLGRNIVNSKAFKIRAFTGPSFSWLMSANATGTRDGIEIDDANSHFDFDEFTWLWTLGGGIEIFMFSLDARYSFDVKGIEGANGLEQSFKQKTNLVEFTLGFKFF